MGSVVADSVTAEHDAARDPRFALAKFRPPALPKTLVVRSGLRERLPVGAAGRLTVVVGPAGAGKSVLLADWAAARPAGVTAWMHLSEPQWPLCEFLALLDRAQIWAARGQFREALASPAGRWPSP